MATTRYSKNVQSAPVKTARFDVTADNDVLFEASGDLIVIGVVLHSGVTALNINAGADITAYPVQLAAGQDLCVTTAGAGSVTVLFIDALTPGYDTFDV